MSIHIYISNISNMLTAFDFDMEFSGKFFGNCEMRKPQIKFAKNSNQFKLENATGASFLFTN